MKKGKLLGLFILSLVLISILLVSVSQISAATVGPCRGSGDCGPGESCINNACVATSTTASTGPGVICDKLPTTWTSLQRMCTVWLKPQASDLGTIGELTKWFLLFLVVILIYAALAAADFPPNTLLRIIISVVVGLLATILITTEELITMLQGYTALGVTIGVALPFIIMGFFTIMVARSMSPIGIYLQKVLWVIFAGYMIIKTFVLAGVVYGGVETPANSGFYNLFGASWLHFKVGALSAAIAKGSDTGMLIILVIASIVALFVMLSNKLVIAWFAKENLDAAVQAKKQKIDLSDAYDTLRAQNMESNKKV